MEKIFALALFAILASTPCFANDEHKNNNGQQQNQPTNYDPAAGGRVDTNTGSFQQKAAGGHVDTNTGTFHQDVAGGSVNTKTGTFTPDK